eukprot:TRINITY_DN21253_c0_g1_i1.p1 TRINITY_DN21253_c0_g1~~TRINITY_DN21253_c0_g1_i1.p1  ORF type:complete len:773 (+),score=123.09 TRINITY_DN21253_c0_g1_i1:32-2320(+)
MGTYGAFYAAGLTPEHIARAVSAQFLNGSGAHGMCAELDIEHIDPFRGIGVVPRKVYCLHRQCDLVWQTFPGRVVVGSYAAAVILSLVFLIWESGPLHATKLRESSFITFILLSVMITTLGADFHVDCWNIEGLMFGYIMFLLVFYHIMRYHVHMKALSTFFGKHNCRAAVKFPKASPSGLHAARRITSAIDNVTTSQESGLLKSDVLLCGGIILSKMCRTLMEFDNSAYSGSHNENASILQNKWWNVAVAMWLILIAYNMSCDIPLLYHMYQARSIVRKTVAGLVYSNDAGGLAYLLAHVSVGHMIHLSEVWSIWPAAHRSVLSVLTEEALPSAMLDTVGKAIILDGLMKSGMGLEKTQTTAARVICSCRGLQLTELKNLMDSGGEVYNLYKLVYIDISIKAIRERVLHHIASEGLACRTRRGGRVGVKVVSDVDDTILCSGGRPAGCDKQYPKKAVYPGALSLYAAVAWSCSENACDLVFLSARPHIYKNVTEKHSYHLFQSLVDEGSMQGTPTLLPGRIAPSLKGAVLSMLQGTRAWKEAGEIKFHTFKDFRHLYPEYDFVFSGDDGQGDLLAGQRMLRQLRQMTPTSSEASLSDTDSESADGEVAEGGEVLAVLIHSVLPREQRPLSLVQASLSSQPCNGLIIGHRTFVGAAVELHEAGLLAADKLGVVAAQAIDDFENMCVVYSDEWDEERRESAEEELRGDLERAAKALRKDDSGAMPLPRLRPFEEVMEARRETRLECADWAEEFVRRNSTGRPP